MLSVFKMINMKIFPLSVLQFGVNSKQISTWIFLSVFSLLSCGAQKKDNQINSIEIGEIQMGSQIWMDKHLSVKTFRNGDPIPEAQSREAWKNAGIERKPAWCYYENDPGTGEKYGVMYNWYAVSDPRGLAPEGWHIPTNEDWITLENYFGIPDAGTKMKCDSLQHKNTDRKGNTDFCILLGGYRTIEGIFTGLGEFTYLTGVTEDQLPESKDKYFIWGRGLHSENAKVMRCGLEKEFGLYVRCVRDMK
jgi:uncharacterized protein (TIGR02145 family)